MKILKTHIESRIIGKEVHDIKRYCGLSVKPCDYFTGIRELGDTGRKYFNILLNKRDTHSSTGYRHLQMLVRKGLLKGVEPNGVRRVSIFIKS